MTHHNDSHDFEQFSGRLNAPVAPTAAFTASLKARVAKVPVLEILETVRTSRMLPVSNASIPTGTESVIEESWRPPRWMRTIEVAVASLLVLSLATASVVFRQPSAPWDFAYQSAPGIQSLEVNAGGDSGRTWSLGDVEPETGGYRIDPNISVVEMQFGLLGHSRLLVDDSFVSTFGPDSSEGNLVRYDLERSEKVWTSSAIVAGQVASDGERIFAFQAGAVAATELAALIAIDFETGDVVWEGPALASEPNSFSSLVLSNGAVFATDYLGNVVAVNGDDGSLTWQYPETLAVPPANEETTVPTGGAELSSLTPEIAANDESVFIGLSSKTVLKLDRETGADLGSIDLLDDYGADIVYTTIQVRAHRLVVTAVHAEQKSDQEDIFGHFPTNVLVFDAESLQLRTQTDLRDHRSNIALTDDAAFIATSIEPNGIVNVYRLDLGAGELGQPLLGLKTTRGMFLSVSGNVLMVSGYPSNIGFFDLDSGELINVFELDAPILETPFDQPVQMWKSNPIVITALGEVYVIEDEATPAP